MKGWIIDDPTFFLLYTQYPKDAFSSAGSRIIPSSPLIIQPSKSCHKKMALKIFFIACKAHIYNL